MYNNVLRSLFDFLNESVDTIIVLTMTYLSSKRSSGLVIICSFGVCIQNKLIVQCLSQLFYACISSHQRHDYAILVVALEAGVSAQKFHLFAVWHMEKTSVSYYLVAARLVWLGLSASTV